MDDKMCQTRLMVFPHFLRNNEIASVLTDISIQTSVTCQPSCSISEIIPQLKSYLEHEGKVVEVSGDSQKNRSILDIIRGIIKDVEDSHNHMFDNDYIPPKVPDELKQMNENRKYNRDERGEHPTTDTYDYDTTDNELFVTAKDDSLITATDELFVTAKDDSLITATDESFVNVTQPAEEKEKCPECKDEEKQKEKEKDKQCLATCSEPDETFATLAHPEDETFTTVDKPGDETFANLEQPPDESFADVDHPPDETFDPNLSKDFEKLDKPEPIDESFANLEHPPDESFADVDHPPDETFDPNLSKDFEKLDKPEPLDESFAEVDHPPDETFVDVDHPPEGTLDPNISQDFEKLDKSEPADESFAILDQPADESFAVLDQPADESFDIVESPEEKDIDKPLEDGDQPKKDGTEEAVSKCQKDCICAGFKIKLFINNIGGLTDGDDPTQKTCIELNVLPGLEKIEVKAIVENKEEEIPGDPHACPPECCPSKELENKFPGEKRGNFILPDGRGTTCPAVIYNVTKDGLSEYHGQESIVEDTMVKEVIVGTEETSDKPDGKIKCICGSTTKADTAKEAQPEGMDKEESGASAIVKELVEKSMVENEENPSSDYNVAENVENEVTSASYKAAESDATSESANRESEAIVETEDDKNAASSKIIVDSENEENADSTNVDQPAKQSLFTKAIRLSSNLKRKSRKSSKEEKPDEESYDEGQPCSCGNELIKDFDAPPKRTCTCQPIDYKEETEETAQTANAGKAPAEEIDDQSEMVEEPTYTYEQVANVEATSEEKEPPVAPEIGVKAAISKSVDEAVIPESVSPGESENAEIQPIPESDYLEDQIIVDSTSAENEEIGHLTDEILQSATSESGKVEGEIVEPEKDEEGAIPESDKVDDGGKSFVKPATAGKEPTDKSCVCGSKKTAGTIIEPKTDIFCEKTRVIKRKSRELLQSRAMSISNLLDGNIMALVSKSIEGFSIILNIKNTNENKPAGTSAGEKNVETTDGKAKRELPPCKCNPNKPTPICECDKLEFSPRNQQNPYSDDEYETCSEGPSTARSRRAQETTDPGPSANAQLTLPDNTVLNLRVTLDMNDMKDAEGRRPPTKKHSARGVPSTTMKNHPSVASTATGILPHRTQKLYDIDYSPDNVSIISKTYLKDVNSFLFTDSSRTINILTPSMMSRASYLSSKPMFNEHNPDAQHNVPHPALVNKESVSGKNVDQTVSFRTRFRNTIEYASDTFNKIPDGSEVMIRNEVRITPSKSLPEMAELGDAATCTKKTCAFFKKADKKPCTCQSEDVNVETSSTKVDPKKESGQYQDRPDIVFMAYRECEKELKPIHMALNNLKKELKTLNMPEIDCIFGKEPIPDIPKMSFFQQKMREFNNTPVYMPPPSPPPPIIKLKLTPTPSKASQGATGMKTKTRIKFNNEQKDIRTPEIMSRTVYPQPITKGTTKQRCNSSGSCKRNATCICPTNQNSQLETSPRIISTTKIKLPRAGSKTCQNYDSTSNRSYGGKIMGITPRLSSKTAIKDSGRTYSNTQQNYDSTSPRIFSTTKIKMPLQPNSNLYQSYGGNYYNTSKTQFSPTAESYDYYQTAGPSRMSQRLDQDMRYPQRTNFDSAYHSYPNSSGCNYSGSSFPEQNQPCRSQTTIKIHMNDKGIQINPSKTCKGRVRIMSNHSLRPNLSGSFDHDGTGSSKSNISNVSCVSSEEFVCPSTHPSPPVSPRKGQKRKHSSKASCASSDVSVCPFMEAMMSMLSVGQKPRKKGKCTNKSCKSNN